MAETTKGASTTRLALGIAILAFLLAVIAFVQTRSGQSAQPVESSLSVVRVGVVPAPPVSLYDAGSNKADGHAVDMLEAIAKRSGVKFQYAAANWATMGASLTSRQVDVVVGPIFMTEARAREFLFSAPIYEFAVVPVVAATNDTIKSASDLTKPGLRVAVGRGGFDADFVSKFMPEAIKSEFPPDDPNLSMLEVRSGRADVALVDFATAMRFARDNPQVKVLKDVIASRQHAGFMYRNDDRRLKDFLDLALANLDLSGERSLIDSRYASNRIWYKQPSSAR